MFKYYEECLRLETYPLPIFSKVKDGVLDLRNYVVSEGVCRAFSEAIALYPEMIT